MIEPILDKATETKRLNQELSKLKIELKEKEVEAKRLKRGKRPSLGFYRSRFR